MHKYRCNNGTLHLLTMKICLYRFGLNGQFRSRVYILIFITVFNFIFGLFLISSVISFVERTPPQQANLVDQPIEEEEVDDVEIEIKSPIKKLIEVQDVKSSDFYFRIDFTIVQTSCKSMSFINSPMNQISLKQFTLDKLSSIIKPNGSFDISIHSFNPILLRIEGKDPQNGLNRMGRSLCSYLIELQISLSFDRTCKSVCQNEYVRRLTSTSRPFGDPIEPALTFNLNYSSDLTNKLIINRMLIYQSTKYLNKTINIRSLLLNRYVSALILDASGSQSSVIMSDIEQRQWIIKTGLDENCYERDCSSIFVSFLLGTSLNSYLRHENGRIRLSRYQNDYLFKGDATFKLLTSPTNKDRLAFESINLPGHLIQVDQQTKTALVLTQPEDSFDGVDQVDKSFLFEFISN